jgi:hypothetical protein
MADKSVDKDLKRFEDKHGYLYVTLSTETPLPVIAAVQRSLINPDTEAAGPRYLRAFPAPYPRLHAQERFQCDRRPDRRRFPQRMGDHARR